MQIRYAVPAIVLIGLAVLLGSVPLVQAQSTLMVDGGNVGCSDVTGGPYCTIQAAVNDASNGDNIDVAAGTYTENVLITTPVTLRGANAGVAGNDDANRGSETVVQPQQTGNNDDTIFGIAASDVTIDGFLLDAEPSPDEFAEVGIGIDATTTSYTDITVQNNIIEHIPSISEAASTPAAGIGAQGPSSGNMFQDNLMRDFGAFASGTFDTDNANAGIGLAGNFFATVTNNVTENVAFGILMLGHDATAPDAPQTVTGGSHTNNHRGIVVYPGSVDSAYEVEDVSITGAAEYGITLFRFDGSLAGIGDGSNTVDATLRNVEIRDTGNFDPDASGINVSASVDGGAYEVNVIESTIADNANRGIHASANDDLSSGRLSLSVFVRRSIIEGNGFDPNTNAGRGAGLIAQRGGFIDAENTIITNGSVDADALSIQSAGQQGDNGLMAVTQSQVLAGTGGGQAAVVSNPGSNSPGFLNASLNAWGVTEASNLAITNNAGDVVDYSPFLASNTDTDTGTPGFQGDFSTLILDSASSNSGTNTKLQEGTGVSGVETLVLQSTGGTYDASVPVETSAQVTVADDLSFSGSGPITIVNNELAVDADVSSITNSPDFNVQNRFTGTDGPGNDAGWRILSAPRAGMTGADIGQTLSQASSGSILYTWDGAAQNFVPEDLTSTNNLAAGEGFFLYLFDINGRDQIDADAGSTCGSGSACIQTEGPLSFSDPVSDAFGTGSVDVAIADQDNLTSTEAGYVLGNPFAQSFDIGNLVVSSRNSDVIGTEGQFVASVQAWNPQDGQFEVINADPNLDTAVAPWQGFWVLRTASSDLSTETLTFQSSGRTTGAPFIPAKSMRQPAVVESGILDVTMEVEDGSGTLIASSEASIYARSEATLGNDVYDAPRIAPPNASYAQVSFVRDSDSARQAQHSVPYDLNEHVEIPLHAEGVGLSGTATISTANWTNIPSDWALTLEDTETGAQVPLVPGETYTFDLSETEGGSGGISGGVQGGAVSNPRFIVRAGPEAPLPVELTDFSGQADGQAAVLSWATASETNNAGFNVQRQTESGAYETLTFVEGAGTTDAPQSYQIRVDDLSYGAHTFRLAQVDTDGTATPSEPVEVQVRLQEAMALTPVAPNPVRGQGTVELTVRETQAVTAMVYDALGRRVRTLHEGEVAGQRPETLTIDTATLASGTYFLRVQGETATQTTRFVVVR